MLNSMLISYLMDNLGDELLLESFKKVGEVLRKKFNLEVDEEAFILKISNSLYYLPYEICIFKFDLLIECNTY